MSWSVRYLDKPEWRTVPALSALSSFHFYIISFSSSSFSERGGVRMFEMVTIIQRINASCWRHGNAVQFDSWRHQNGVQLDRWDTKLECNLIVGNIVWYNKTEVNFNPNK